MLFLIEVDALSIGLAPCLVSLNLTSNLFKPEYGGDSSRLGYLMLLSMQEGWEFQIVFVYFEERAVTAKTLE